MQPMILRLDEDTKQDLLTIKEQEKRPMATIIREAIIIYLNDKQSRQALSWFISKYCSRCFNRIKCDPGSVGMIECMCEKMRYKNTTQGGE